MKYITRFKDKIADKIDDTTDGVPFFCNQKAQSFLDGYKEISELADSVLVGSFGHKKGLKKSFLKFATLSALDGMFRWQQNTPWNRLKSLCALPFALVFDAVGKPAIAVAAILTLIVVPIITYVAAAAHAVLYTAIWLPKLLFEQALDKFLNEKAYNNMHDISKDRPILPPLYSSAFTVVWECFKTKGIGRKILGVALILPAIAADIVSSVERVGSAIAVVFGMLPTNPVEEFVVNVAYLANYPANNKGETPCRFAERVLPEGLTSFVSKPFSSEAETSRAPIEIN